MRIGELSRRTGVPARLLRYYEEQGLLEPARDANDYRLYGEECVARVRQVRGLLETGLSTRMIRTLLPFLGEPGSAYPALDSMTPEVATHVESEVEKLQSRIDALVRSRDALRTYLTNL
ncbi:MerR family transcriptional regulator [Streptomyces sp. NPDC001262]|uniref:MerR family transcriptional regulator n=1 Tax=Streptomyces sp. NPDC001262 TaxID=3364552 RepID=UPI003688DC6A